MERKGDEVPERALRHEVLGGEEPVVADEVELGPDGHGLSQQVDTDPPGRRGRDRAGEEHPHVAAVAGAGPLQRGRDAGRPGGVEIGQGVEDPTGTVEVAHQQPARIAPEQRVEPGVDRAGQVPLSDLIGEGQVLPVRATGVAPSTGYGGSPTAFACPLVLPAQGVHVIAPAEQRPKQRHFRRTGRRPVNPRRCRGRGLRLNTKQGRRPPGRLHFAGPAIQAEQLAQARVLRP